MLFVTLCVTISVITLEEGPVVCVRVRVSVCRLKTDMMGRLRIKPKTFNPFKTAPYLFFFNFKCVFAKLRRDQTVAYIFRGLFVLKI